ncbi:MAG: S-methyl-5-thioribose-1-phosphate isomerase [Bacteroidota bacterium]
MKIDGKHFHTIWTDDNDNRVVRVIDQRYLPHEFIIKDLKSSDDFVIAIKDMIVRGAPLIGVAAAYGMYLAALEAPQNQKFETSVNEVAEKLRKTRPTAINLSWAIETQLNIINQKRTFDEKIKAAFNNAVLIKDNDIETCRKIGEFGLSLIQNISNKKNGDTVNILTHCNAGWLACIDWGTATSAIYQAFKKGIKIHIWVDETRPRNQGASLTAFELGQQGIPHTLIVDNAGGHLMQHGMVDIVITGSDRTTYTGDVVNKIGTYLKALAANDNNIPFYVALPSTSIDWKTKDGLEEIPIEERDEEEVRFIQGKHNGKIKKVLIAPEASPAANYGFDITPARLITGLITERGICGTSEKGISDLFPEKSKNIA